MSAPDEPVQYGGPPNEALAIFNKRMREQAELMLRTCDLLERAVLLERHKDQLERQVADLKVEVAELTKKARQRRDALRAS